MALSRSDYALVLVGDVLQIHGFTFVPINCKKGLLQPRETHTCPPALCVFHTTRNYSYHHKRSITSQSYALPLVIAVYITLLTCKLIWKGVDENVAKTARD